MPDSDLENCKILEIVKQNDFVQMVKPVAACKVLHDIR